MIDYGNILTVFYPNKKWTIKDSIDYDTLNWLDNSSKPTKEELDSKSEETISELKKSNCKNKSKNLIANSDWSVLPDVNLQNKSDFELYREILRNYILNPIENPIYPEEPTPIWIVTKI
jgi:hypothetical protein